MKTEMKRAKIFLPDDLIAEILIRLPARSIGRFRCVCKRWLSLSSDPKFKLAHASRAQISALFGLHRNDTLLDSRRLGSSCSLPSPLPGDCCIDSSCNGLILLRREDNSYCFLFNPVTMTSWPAISLPCSNKAVLTSTLAYDPSRSLHFKILALFWTGVPSVAIYSSCTLNWRPIASVGRDLSLRSATYFRGHILWWDRVNGCLVCFDVESESFETSVQPPPDRKTFHHLGVSGGQLYFIGCSYVSDLRTSFHIWQLLPDFSGWSKLCSVKLIRILRALYPAYPHILRALYLACPHILRALYPAYPVHFYRGKAIDAIYFHKGKGKEGDQLLMSSHNKFFSYHLQNRTCTILSDNLKPANSWWRAIPYAETILSP